MDINIDTFEDIPTEEIQILPATDDHLKEACGILLKEGKGRPGWEFPRPSDFRCWRRAFGKGSFLVAIHKKNGRLLGTVSWNRYEDSERPGIILQCNGWYWVRQNVRSKGLGMCLSLASTGKGTELEAHRNYFCWAGDGKMLKRYKAMSSLSKQPDYHVERLLIKVQHTPQKQMQAMGVQPKTSVRLSSTFEDQTDLICRLVSYDFELNGRIDRGPWIEHCLLGYEGAHVYVALDDSTDKVSGFGSIKPDAIGRKIVAPLYANSKEAALMIFEKLVTEHVNSGDLLFLSYLSNNDAMLGVIEGVGEVLETSQAYPVYSTHIIDFKPKKVYCVGVGGCDIVHV